MGVACPGKTLREVGSYESVNKLYDSSVLLGQVDIRENMTYIQT